MKLLVLFDHRFLRAPNGEIFSDTSYSYSFFSQRYLPVFDEVLVLARVARTAFAPSGCGTEGPGVRVLDLPDWSGPIGFIRNRKRITEAVRAASRTPVAVTMIVPGGIASVAFEDLAGRAVPFCVEVVGDPWESLGPGASTHPLRPILRRWLSRTLKRQCERAHSALYVTKEAIQRRYPCPGIAAGVSDVVLPREAFAPYPKFFDEPARKLIVVGTLAQLYKGHDLLLDAVHRCVTQGLNIRLTVVGDGRHREALAARAVKLGLEGRVQFTGQLSPASEVRRELDKSDLFVLPSRTEGLPRALAEAMARGLPCIASDVGGIPELLEPEEMVRAGEVGSLAAKIAEVLADPVRLSVMAARNLRKAHDYSEDILVPRRIAFYRKVREIAEGQTCREYAHN